MRTRSVERLLEKEIAVVVGCTEPAAIAYAVQCARRNLAGPFNENDIKATVRISPEVFRNASTAVVPVVDRRGVRAAVVAGLFSSSRGFNPFADLKIPSGYPLLQRRSWLSIDRVKRRGIYISVSLSVGSEDVRVVVNGRHDCISSIIKNEKRVYHRKYKSIPNLRGLKEIAAIAGRRNERLEAAALRFIATQVKSDPTKPPAAGMAELIARRMAGEKLSVVTIAGSGNQGLFLGIPLFALYNKRGRKALPVILFSILAQIYLSQSRKRVSERCGLGVKAAPALIAGLSYMRGDDIASVARNMREGYERLKEMPCDGARPRCGGMALHALRTVYSVLGMREEE